MKFLSGALWGMAAPCEAVTVGEADTGISSAKANSLNGRLISERPASGAVVPVFEK